MIYSNNQSDSEKAFKWHSRILQSEIVNQYSGEMFLRIVLETPISKNLQIDWYSNNNILCLKQSKFGGMWRISKVTDEAVYCKVDKLEGYEWEVEESLEADFNVNIVKNSYNDNKNLLGYAFFSSPIYVHCRCTLLNLDEIDTVGQSFVASVYCELRLRDISTLSDPLYVNEYLQILNIMEHVDFLNIKSEESKETYNSYSLSSRSVDSKLLYDYTLKIKAKATFSKGMELKMFPFDEQLLNIILTVNRPCSGVVLIHNIEYTSKFLCRSFQHDGAFKIVFNETMFGIVSKSDRSESSSGYEYPRITFSILLSRRSRSYISNTMIPIAVISCLSLVNFGLNEDGSKMDTSSRLSITLTLLLTAVAYKFVVSSALPVLPYNTLLDWYVWFCFAFICLNVCEVTFYPTYVSSFPPEGRYAISKNETNIFYIFIVIFVIGNLVWLVFILWYLSKLKKTHHLKKLQLYL
ncbi:gamma-aminobutyric acid receptor subunit beta-1 isoform X2 [Hydra vulgaris]|uniref:Gamma-aminobutyric acid receptor subunit beta-1 isoform X2 n=1 Tax=Hydra vulgaris TaxID=6087 RepID=A0ABM4C7K5_HYDVU